MDNSVLDERQAESKSDAALMDGIASAVVSNHDNEDNNSDINQDPENEPSDKSWPNFATLLWRGKRMTCSQPMSHSGSSRKTSKRIKRQHFRRLLSKDLNAYQKIGLFFILIVRLKICRTAITTL